MSYVTKDSGKREKFTTGAVRDVQVGKGRYDLISPIAIHRLAGVYERGAQKYADRNWEKGIPLSRCMSSALRHLFQYLGGKRDEDHLAQAMWNIAAMIHFEETRPDLCDLPTQNGTQEVLDEGRLSRTPNPRQARHLVSLPKPSAR